MTYNSEYAGALITYGNLHDYNEKIKETYYNKEEIDGMLSNVGGVGDDENANIDLSNYYTKEEVGTQLQPYHDSNMALWNTYLPFIFQNGAFGIGSSDNSVTITTTQVQPTPSSPVQYPVTTCDIKVSETKVREIVSGSLPQSVEATCVSIGAAPTSTRPFITEFHIYRVEPNGSNVDVEVVATGYAYMQKSYSFTKVEVVTVYGEVDEEWFVMNDKSSSSWDESNLYIQVPDNYRISAVKVAGTGGICAHDEEEASDDTRNITFSALQTCTCNGGDGDAGGSNIDMSQYVTYNELLPGGGDGDSPEGGSHGILSDYYQKWEVDNMIANIGSGGGDAESGGGVMPQTKQEMSGRTIRIDLENGFHIIEFFFVCWDTMQDARGFVYATKSGSDITAKINANFGIPNDFIRKIDGGLCAMICDSIDVTASELNYTFVVREIHSSGLTMRNSEGEYIESEYIPYP